MSKTEWKEVRLGDFVQFQNGFAFKSSDFKEFGDYKVVKIKELKDGLVKFFDDTASVSATNISEKYVLKKGDVIFALTGDPVSKSNPSSWVGRVSIYNKSIPAVLNQRTCKAICSNKIDSTFLYYHFRLWENFYLLASKATGSASQANISTNTIADTLISLPPLAEQQRIAKILSSLDDKIELNNAINRNLEEQAQAIFKNWFIDFEPFGGEMPGDWNETRIGDLPIYVTDYVSNGSFASLKENVSLLQNDGFAYFIRNTDLKVGDFNTFVDEHSYHFLEKSKLFGGEIIISNVGDVGSVFLCPKLNKPMTLGNNIIMLRCLKDFQNYFFYMWFKWFDGQISIKNVTGGSVLQKFNKTDFKNIKIHMPLDESLERFNASISPFINKIEENAKENQRIARVRDELLPKLMSENS